MYQEISITFFKPSAVDKIRTYLKFMPFVYQGFQSIENNKMLIFDIYKFNVEFSQSINPSKVSQKYIYQDTSGFNCFSICRTSEV